MTETPLVSIIIPCYKQAEYLAETIDSALSQTYRPIEVLVVNDGSPDNTEQVARSYGDRVVYIYRENGGLSAARNTAIAQARGFYMKFLDSDDQLHAEQIAWQVEAMAGREDCASLTGVRLYRDGYPEQSQDHVPRANNLLPDLFKDLDWGAPIGWLFPSKLVRAVGGFNEKLRFAEDWDFFCKVGMLQPEPRLLTDERIGCYYRQRPGSMSANRIGMATAKARILFEIHDRLRDRGRSDWFGEDLLKHEQITYEGMVRLGINDPELLNGLLQRIFELQRRVGFGAYGWRFRMLARCLGYARAEQFRSFVVRTLKIKPPESIDMAAWREGAMT
jgi:glycosyltransferase involved in cell wall biosynthesis